MSTKHSKESRFSGYVYVMTIWTEDTKVASRLHFSVFKTQDMMALIFSCCIVGYPSLLHRPSTYLHCISKAKHHYDITEAYLRVWLITRPSTKSAAVAINIARHQLSLKHPIISRLTTPSWLHTTPGDGAFAIIMGSIVENEQRKTCKNREEFSGLKV